MNITNKINMDLHHSGNAAVVQAVQRDRYSRSLEITLYADGEPWTIPQTASVLVGYAKPDGKGGEYDTLPDGTKAWSAAENVLTVQLAPQVLTAAGVVNLCITLMDGNGQVSSFLILVDVQAVPGSDRETSQEYSHITGLLPAPNRARVGNFFRVSAIDEKGHVAGVEAISLEDLETSDEELLAATFTLTEQDYFHGLWNGALDAGSETPYTTTDIGDKFCTRKIKTTKVPQMSYFYFTTPVEYVFWNDGAFVGKVSWAEISQEWKADFVFDEVGINFSWGWEYVGSETVVRLTIAAALFKKALILGDSISADYYGNYTKWVTFLIEAGILPASTTNDSIHATGFVAKYTAEGDTDNDFLHRIQAVTEKDSYDLVVVFGGINDFLQNIPLGQSGGDRAANFVPAVDWCFDYLVDNFPQARIVVLSPLRTQNTAANTQGKLETEYAAYIRQAAKTRCMPVLNLTEESGFCPFREGFKNRWTLVPAGYEAADGVHPNEEYQKKFLAPQIAGFLKQFA